jgi:hypothetical protein
VLSNAVFQKYKPYFLHSNLFPFLPADQLPYEQGARVQ